MRTCETETYCRKNRFNSFEAIVLKEHLISYHNEFICFKYLFPLLNIPCLLAQLIISTEHESAIIQLEYVIAYSIILIDTLWMPP